MLLGQGLASKYYSGFNPLDIGGCTLWLDAADASTITLSGSSVTTWADKSGSGFNATAGVGVTPTFSNNGVDFNGSQRMATDYNATPTAESICIVATITGTTTNRNYFMVGNTGASGLRGYTVNLTSGAYTTNWDRAGVARYAAASGVQNGVRFLTTGVFSGSSGSTGVNGGTQATGSFSFAGTGTTVIGAVSTSQANTSWIGTINEIIIYNFSLAIGQRQQVEAYLAWKWGRRTSLPLRHPYYSIIPVNRPFVPIDLTGCTLWYDGSDKSTMTLTGSTLTTWSNKTGTNVPITTGGTAATVVDSFTPGFSYINVPFGGELRFTTALNTQARSWFFVVRNNTPAADWTNMQLLYPATITTGQDQVFIERVGSSYTLRERPRNTVRLEASVGSPIGVITLYTVINSATTLNTINTNGTPATLTVSTTATGYSGANLLYTFNRADQPGDRVSMDIFEILFYTRDLTIRERQQVEGYLARKWGLAGSLPVAHPFVRRLPSTAYFLPTQIANCALWLDATDFSRFTFSGSNITRWNDKTTNARDAIINGTIGVVGATLNTTFMSGRPMVNFLSSLYDIAYTSFPTSYTIFSVQYNTNNTAGNFGYQRVLNASNADSRIFIGTLNGNVAAFNGNGTSWNDTNSIPVNNFLEPRIVEMRVSGATLDLYTEGTLRVSKVGTTATFNNLWLGYGATGQDWYGGIGEFIIFSVAITTEQRQLVEGYLAWKWGLVNNLPSAHPYKKISPI